MTFEKTPFLGKSYLRDVTVVKEILITEQSDARGLSEAQLII